MSRVGFWGMGGIGKTVTGASIARNEGVRLHFHVIIWLPLGQTPVISKLQNLCHIQCTGKELSPELSSDEKKEALQRAMKGKRVLLCLDDLWEEEHELELNFVDESEGSKVLISTRMKALLDGGHMVEVGLPSPADSARMLLAAADADLSGMQPRGVREIIDMCGRLPLALGIAGRLAASLGLVGTQDWSDMIGVLKEELRESHSGGAEEGMIRASLRGLKGSAKEQANVRSLLLMFALVPEDTHCPLEAMLLMFNAVRDGSGVSMMHIRKWLRILINRSLLLGTVDRPSVHDLVLDFAEAQYSKDKLRDSHRRIVDVFRAARPADSFGRRKFDTMRMNDPLTTYVCSEGLHHVSNGIAHDETCAVAWLKDIPQDPIVLFAGRELGLQKLTAMARRAEADHDWWLAARYWNTVRVITMESEGPSTSAADAAVNSLNVLAKMSEKSSEDWEDLRFEQARTIVNTFAQPLFERLDVIDEITQSGAALRDPSATAGMQMIVAFSIPMLGLPGKSDMTGEQIVAKFGSHYMQLHAFLRSAAESAADTTTRVNCRVLSASLPMMGDMLMGAKGFDWVGSDASVLLALRCQLFSQSGVCVG
eukprot:COSAG06_NODE_1787_length_8398_cov_5.335944_7_plen_595_part_00